MENIGIGTLATKALVAGKSATETLELVKQVFPGCQTTMKGIYYYASKAKVNLSKKSTADPDALAKALKMLETLEAPVVVKKVRTRKAA